MTEATGGRSTDREGYFVRFDVHQRTQHLILFVSFIVLAATGLPLKFDYWAASLWWVGVWGGIDNTRAVHHFAAWVMSFACFYHFVYLGYKVLVRRSRFPTGMIPMPKDVVDMIHEMGYFMSISQTKPRFGRFSWREKFDYWAIFWGMPIMGGSGLILMYPVLATDFLPGWIVPVALVAHSDEAVLAVAWILVVHLFFGHLAPAVFPMNKTIFTGKISWKRMREEHPLEYEELLQAEAEAEAEAEPEAHTGGKVERPQTTAGPPA